MNRNINIFNSLPVFDIDLALDQEEIDIEKEKLKNKKFQEEYDTSDIIVLQKIIDLDFMNELEDILDENLDLILFHDKKNLTDDEFIYQIKEQIRSLQALFDFYHTEQRGEKDDGLSA